MYHYSFFVIAKVAFPAFALAPAAAVLTLTFAVPLGARLQVVSRPVLFLRTRADVVRHWCIVCQRMG